MKKIIFLIFGMLLIFSMFLISGCVKTCPDAGCFKEMLVKCEPIKYTVEDSLVVKEHFIEGLDEGRCTIKTKILSAPEGRIIEKGMDMECVYLNLESILVEFSANEIAPDQNMCSGILIDSLKV